MIFSVRPRDLSSAASGNLHGGLPARREDFQDPQMRPPVPLAKRFGAARQRMNSSEHLAIWIEERRRIEECTFLKDLGTCERRSGRFYLHWCDRIRIYMNDHDCNDSLDSEVPHGVHRKMGRAPAGLSFIFFHKMRLRIDIQIRVDAPDSRRSILSGEMR